MSSRCTIVLEGPFHIYEESNDGFTVCISELDGKRNDYNGDIELDLETLKTVVKELSAYLEDK